MGRRGLGERGRRRGGERDRRLGDRDRGDRDRCRRGERDRRRRGLDERCLRRGGERERARRGLGDRERLGERLRRGGERDRERLRDLARPMAVTRRRWLASSRGMRPGAACGTFCLLASVTIPLAFTQRRRASVPRLALGRVLRGAGCVAEFARTTTHRP